MYFCNLLSTSTLLQVLYQRNFIIIISFPCFDQNIVIALFRLTIEGTYRLCYRIGHTYSDNTSNRVQ